MDKNQERKFICKFCNKRYPCGKSLGGHIRTHMNLNSADAQAHEFKLSKSKILSIDNNGSSSSKADSGPEAAAQSGYGLRENPKKTRRFADSRNHALQQHHQLLCKECGKGFQSLKALCGHMASHSERDKVSNHRFEDHPLTDEKQKLVMDSQSDTETSTPSRRRRSKRMRYYNNNNNNRSTDVNYSNSVSLANGSSSISEIEQEQEEVAMCLMMLSRDSSFRKGLNSFAESSDNNSVVLEAKSSSIDLRITIKTGLSCTSNADKFLETNKSRDGKKLKSAENGFSSSDNSDSGYFRNGPKKVESDVSVDGCLGNAEFRSGFEDMKAKSGKNMSKFKSMTDFGNGRADRGASTKYALRKGTKKSDSLLENCQKISLSSNKTSEYWESIYECGENSLESDPTMAEHAKITKSCSGKNPGHDQKLSGNGSKKMGKKKSKGHECPFCFRVFKSGQALGGHKRSHFVGTHDDSNIINNNTVVIKQDLPDQIPTLIDLNLPAPIDEEEEEEEEAIGS